MPLKNIAPLLLLFAFSACSRLKEASHIFSTLPPKEQYKKEFQIPDTLFNLWEKEAQNALEDSLEPELPFAEIGYFKPRSFPVYGYTLHLHPGEILSVSVQQDSVQNLIFLSLFQQKDSVFKELKTSEFKKSSLTFEVEENASYKLLFQPEIEAQGSFQILIESRPTYLFPVSGGKNADIGSFWGASRDAGARKHEGNDIFAKRGTPVLAVTTGRIGYTGEKGLGGKQVWLRDSRRRQSVYYAHLDSINSPQGKVEKGDTLGFVGNTGNAIHSPPHLHFGIYKRGHGAINPLYFIKKQAKLNLNENSKSAEIPQQLQTTGKTVHLRNRPSTSNSVILGNTKAGDTLKVLGKTGRWYHVRSLQNKSAFIYGPLVKPLKAQDLE